MNTESMASYVTVDGSCGEKNTTIHMITKVATQLIPRPTESPCTKLLLSSSISVDTTVSIDSSFWDRSF